MNVPRILAATAMLATVGISAQSPVSAADRPTFPRGTATALVPWGRPMDFDHLRGLLAVKLSLNGGPAENFVVDTGSTGIVVAATSIKDFDGKGEPGELTYSSSGISEIGVWKEVDVTFADAKSTTGKPVTARVRVLAVTSVKCSGKGVNAAKCDSSAAPSAHMMGIGFGRGHDATFDLQRNNPFVMVHEMETGQMRRGYTITPQGVQLGLTQDSVGPGWVWQKLSPRADVKVPDDYTGPKDWTTAPGTFSIGDARAMPMGTILMDTGLTNMILEADGAPAEGDLPAGTPVTIDLLSGKLKYSFLVNDAANPANPRKTSWRKPSGTYVNTGLHALTLYDYCYDADGGYLGLRPRAKASTPTTAK